MPRRYDEKMFDITHLRKTAEKLKNWGKWGPDDEKGTLNYITPEIVGGTSGTFISNRIAYHISSSLNCGLAAALATILLIAVLFLYYAYDKIVGIDNVKLG